MRAAWVFVVMSFLPACNRAEEPPSSVEPRTRTPAEARGVPSALVSGSGGAPSPPAKAACLVETPAEAPPVARPAKHCPTDPGPVLELPQGTVSFPAATGSPTISVEIARLESHRARGLMYRTELSSDRGMLFSWQEELQRTFWMRTTCIPLDMLFIALDGTIVGILEQVPVMNDAPRTIPCPAAHVLEVPAGWCRERSVKAGMRVVIQ